MNYNTVFAPTAYVERTAKAHALNLPTYFLTAAVILLTAIKAVFDFASEQLERLPEYRLRLTALSLRFQIAKVRLYRRIVASIIVMTIRASELKSIVQPRAANTGAFLISIADRIFCIE